MSYRTVLDVKNSSTNAYATFDFSQDLAVGETIASASTAATVYSGSGTATGLVSGTPTIAGGQVTQRLFGGTVGTVYSLACSATTSSGRALVREGYLAVKTVESI